MAHANTTTAPAYLITEPTTYGIFFKWTTSRAADSYGYNICTLLIDGKKAASTCGGGYDMEGTALGRWITKTFPVQLRALAAERVAAAEAAGAARYYDGGQQARKEAGGQDVYLYGLTVFKAEGEAQPVQVTCDGGTGRNQMQQILKVLGLKWHSIRTGRNTYAHEISNQ